MPVVAGSVTRNKNRDTRRLDFSTLLFYRMTSGFHCAASTRRAASSQSFLLSTTLLRLLTMTANYANRRCAARQGIHGRRVCIATGSDTVRFGNNRASKLDG